MNRIVTCHSAIFRIIRLHKKANIMMIVVKNCPVKQGFFIFNPLISGYKNAYIDHLGRNYFQRIVL